MILQVGLDGGVQILGRHNLQTPSQALPDFYDLFFGGAQGGEAGGNRFDGQPDLAQIAQETRIGFECRLPAEDVRIKLVPLRAGERPGAGARTHLHHALVLQHLDGFAQNAAADPQLLAQFAFVGEDQTSAWRSDFITRMARARVTRLCRFSVDSSCANGTAFAFISVISYAQFGGVQREIKLKKQESAHSFPKWEGTVAMLASG